MFSHDSIPQQPAQTVGEAVASGAFEGDSAVQRPSRPQTPYQVLRMLPKDATPAQQDSAIQAWFQPKAVRYSRQPDTLHLPGHGVGRNPKDVSLPKYYKESFFAKDSLLHPELNGGRYGVAGDPVPYTIRGDNTISILLILCFVVTLVSFARTSHYILHQVKDFFYIPRRDTSVNETSGEVHFQLFLLLHTCLQLGLLSYLCITHYLADTFMLESQYQLIGILFAMMLGYFLLKAVAYSFVNAIFFDGKKSEQWLGTLLFITSLEGLLLLPVVLLQVYFSLSMQNVVYYCAFVLILVKILTFYKCWAIFFRNVGFFLQIILYFCALEIIPLLALGGAVVMMVNELKVNF